MVINGTVVLAVGILSVLGVAVHNNHRASAASPTIAAAEAVAAPAPELPRGYLANPATSPLAGFAPAALPPARPILRSDSYLATPASFN